MRLGIFGGSFDPVHFGHLLLAETCRESCRLDQVWFVPNAQPPHKPDRLLTSVRQRLEMLELAIAGNSALWASPIEANRGGLSFTVDTLDQVHREYPDAELFFLLGADALRDLPTWREPARICALATPLIVGRPGAPPPDLAVLQPFLNAARLAAIRQNSVQMPLFDLSSTELRNRVFHQQSIRYRTPRSVEAYIQQHRLYLGDSR